jgi:OOP family OmpA-OmpF porin
MMKHLTLFIAVAGISALSVSACAQTENSAPISAYNNYDFVPGDQIIFDDSFTGDQNGEFPAHWNLGAGQAVVNTIAGRPAFLLTDGNYAHVSPLIKSPAYLGAAFTIEFDLYNNGGYPPKMYFYNSNANATAASSDQANITFEAGGINIVNKNTGLDITGNMPAAIAGENFKNKWHHIAIAYKNNQVKVYVDQYRVAVAPNLGTAPKAFDIEGIGDANTPIIMTNFRIANGGGMNMLGKKFTDAKLITHGINFDVDKAIIKPESMGTLNMIVGILKDNPDLKFEIDGHTDNTGDAAHNITLSQQRADAVKTQLLSMGVNATRLSTKGFGDTKPISDNTTPEGRANNRRVEFVKQ